MTSSRDVWVAGVDGCRNGWMVVLWHPSSASVRRRMVNTANALVHLPETPAIVGVDMVIGCPDAAEPDGRQCDRAARQLLGHPRGTSVFSPPAYDALWAETYEEAVRRNRASGPEAPGLSKQTFHLFPKLRELAECMTPPRQERIREVHPELAFYAMNGDAPVEASKHTDAGRARRLDLLSAHGFPDVRSVAEPRGATGLDDVLDAHAACWTARRIHDGTAERCPPLPSPAPCNDRDLRMEIWR